MAAISQALNAPLFIVAGPGTGKTTCLALRILKLILVDGIPPKSLLATTFTKKAAAELRSRILGWGFQIIEILQGYQLEIESQTWLEKLDINQVLTGTIDSLCEQILRDYRDPGTQPPILIDDYVSRTLLLREGLFGNARYQDEDLDHFLFELNGAIKFGWRIGRKVELLQNIWDRRFQDQVDWAQFLASGQNELEERAIALIGQAISDYQQALEDRMMTDFALLEQEMLTRLKQKKLNEFCEQVQVILVDEYQDTNLLQEQIYFELAKSCCGAITVVGDDDQSLYRFRGATVELFSNFSNRYESVFHQIPKTVFLKTNYRSTQTIVEFVNDYAELDYGYQHVRVDQKPRLLHGPMAPEGFAILGLFEPTRERLAERLADILHQIFRGNGFMLPDGSMLQANEQGGDFGDCALLCSSPQEYNSSNKPRLPVLLKHELLERSPAVEVFNPRGQELVDIPVIAIFGGLILGCLDPDESIQEDVRGLNQDIQNTFNAWRQSAMDFVYGANCPERLQDYAEGWSKRIPEKSKQDWPKSVPILELIYGLVHFFPELHDDPEGQIYLEVFTRQVSACEQIGKFSGRVIHDQDNPGLGEASVKELIRDFLAPVASGTVKVNEDLMEAFPRDRLSVLSIHQSKGLEFPFTIVDVGSDFPSNHRAHRFKRFPVKEGNTQTMEDLLRPHTELNASSRGGLDRTFDDLYRQFFVAYSRPKDVLLLVGLESTLPGGKVPNIATGWMRDLVCPWDKHRPFILL